MNEYVDVLIAPQDRLSAMRELDEWSDQHGVNRVWTIGEESGQVVIYDAPAAALECLRRRAVPFETRPRDPRRPFPVPV